LSSPSRSPWRGGCTHREAKGVRLMGYLCAGRQSNGTVSCDRDTLNERNRNFRQLTPRGYHLCGRYLCVRRSLLALSGLLLARCSCIFRTKNYPQTGAMCGPQTTDLGAVWSKAEAGDALAEYELGRAMLSPQPTDSEFAAAMSWFRRSAEQGYAPAEYMYGSIFVRAAGKIRSSWFTGGRKQQNREMFHRTMS
jgi:hypothetical protein